MNVDAAGAIYVLDDNQYIQKWPKGAEAPDTVAQRNFQAERIFVGENGDLYAAAPNQDAL